MPIVHAYRRTKPHTVELRGAKYKFTANDDGAQVCDVPDGPVLDRLLEIDDAYKLYSTATAADADEGGDADVSPFVLTSGEGDQTIDLRKLTKPKLIEFASENDLKIDPTLKVDDYRQAIVDALKVE